MIDMPLDDRVLTAIGTKSLSSHVAIYASRPTPAASPLRGVVNTYFQKQMAQEAIRHVDGVAEIANELEVCWT